MGSPSEDRSCVLRKGRIVDLVPVSGACRVVEWIIFPQVEVFFFFLLLNVILPTHSITTKYFVLTICFKVGQKEGNPSTFYVGVKNLTTSRPPLTSQYRRCMIPEKKDTEKTESSLRKEKEGYDQTRRRRVFFFFLSTKSLSDSTCGVTQYFK